MIYCPNCHEFLINCRCHHKVTTSDKSEAFANRPAPPPTAEQIAEKFQKEILPNLKVGQSISLEAVRFTIEKLNKQHQ